MTNTQETSLRRKKNFPYSTLKSKKVDFEHQYNMISKQQYFYQRLLNEELANRLQKNSHYSLRSFARSLQIDVGALSKILSGLKIPTPSLTKKILTQLDLTQEQQKQFLLSTAQAYKKKGVQRKPPEIKALLKHSKEVLKTPEKDLTPEVFRIISDWYHYAILQLVQTENFKPETKWIASQLGIQEIEIKMAIDRLKQLELLKEKDGTLIRSTERLTSGDLAITTPGLKKRINQVTEKSLYSLEHDPISERNHTTMTMSIDPEKISLAKDMIQDFMDQLSVVLQTKKKRVYELQINLFPLQKEQK